MSKTAVSVPLGQLVVECRRCGSRASIRSGKEYLCARCALETGVRSDESIVDCDLCERDSLVRLGEQFLCASCALWVLQGMSEVIEGSARAPSAEPLVDLISGGEESLLAHGLENGNLVRDGAVRLVDAAAAHHQVLARSLRRARDRDECIRRVEAAAVLFNVWAFSFDARLEELECRNEVLARSRSSSTRDPGRTGH